MDKLSPLVQKIIAGEKKQKDAIKAGGDRLVKAATSSISDVDRARWKEKAKKQQDKTMAKEDVNESLILHEISDRVVRKALNLGESKICDSTKSKKKVK